MNKSNKMPKPPIKKVNCDTIKRLMSYLKLYKSLLVIFIVCIVLSSVARVASSLFLQRLIDDYISPILLEQNPVFTGLLNALMFMGVIFIIGVITTFIFSRTMAYVSQGILKKIRNQMFSHMQSLPIKYFDTHTHGDIMSYYTNDTDALRQMLSQTIPQTFSSLITIVVVFASMLTISFWLTLFVVCFIFLMKKIITKIAGSSGKYFVRQQASIADVNGYIEEMIHGKKVIKVFF